MRPGNVHRPWWVLLLGYGLVPALVGGFISLWSTHVIGPAPGPRVSIPAGLASQFAPSGYDVERQITIPVPGQPAPDLVVSAISLTLAYYGWTHSDVYVLAYDKATKQWVEAFSALHQSWYQSSATTCCAGSALIYTAEGPVVFRDADRPASDPDLALFVNALEGNEQKVIAAVIRLSGDHAHVVATYQNPTGHPGGAEQGSLATSSASIIGPSGDQQLRVTMPLNTFATSESEAARMYFVDIGRTRSGSVGLTYTDDPELGVSCGFDTNVCNVTTVVRGLPAASVLRKGDLITGIDGVPLSDEHDYGPTGYSELQNAVSLHHPGQTVSLTVRRGGVTTSVRVVLSQCGPTCVDSTHFVV